MPAPRLHIVECSQRTACEKGGNALTEYYDSARSIHNLALIGFMGTGKSGVGRLVADLIHFTFLDTDHVIEARAGKPSATFSPRTASRPFGSGSGGWSKS